MTASLLARKGQAAPSLSTLPARPRVFGDGEAPFPPPPPRPIGGQPLERSSVQARVPEPVLLQKPQAGGQPVSKPAHEPPPQDHADKPRRIMVTLSAEEFERLGIAAIKKDCSRHAIVHTALNAYFNQLATELPRRCACMANGSCCS
jgi:hypothetical protein